MMFLSHLLIDVGDNPDHPRPGRTWMRNVYHVHQRLSMAFPSREKRKNDEHFLAPFDPADFERPRFLFRIDNAIEEDTPRAVVLVQSELEPDWDYAFHNARMILAASPETRDYSPVFSDGERYRFRIRVNLTKASSEHQSGSPDKVDKFGRPKTRGRRVAFTWDKEQGPDDAVREWFSSKGAGLGFTLETFELVHLGWISGYRPPRKGEAGAGKDENDGHHMKWRSALVEGTLAVSKAVEFGDAVQEGIGHAKAFGFGLLSLAPA